MGMAYKKKDNYNKHEKETILMLFSHQSRINIGVRATFGQKREGGGGGGGEPFAQKCFVSCPIFKKQSKRNEGHTMH